MDDLLMGPILRVLEESERSGGRFFGYLAYFCVAAGLWKIFEKAGKPAWAGVVPLYNLWVLLEVVGMPRWSFLLFFVPVANLVALGWLCVSLATCFGKDRTFAVGLFVLSFIFFPLLGFGDAEYHPPVRPDSSDETPISAGEGPVEAGVAPESAD